MIRFEFGRFVAAAEENKCDLGPVTQKHKLSFSFVNVTCCWIGLTITSVLAVKHHHQQQVQVTKIARQFLTCRGDACT